jgi:Ribosomal protein L7/L12 C-terminal domain
MVWLEGAHSAPTRRLEGSPVRACKLCQHANPNTAERCESCGAWIEGSSAAPSATSPGSLAEMPPKLRDDLTALLRANRKIDAIKVYREATGQGLKESKDAVETFAARAGLTAKPGGCAGVVLLALFVAVGFVAVWLA